MQKKEFIIIPNSKRLSSFKVRKFILPLEDYSIGFDTYFTIKEINRMSEIYDITVIMNKFLHRKIDEFRKIYPLFNEKIKFMVEDIGLTDIIDKNRIILYENHIISNYRAINYLKELTYAKTEFDKVKEALESVNETGYGVVYPKQEDIVLEEPVLTKQSGKYGVKIKAKAPSLHIMRVDVDAEISPIVGTQNQSEDLIKFLKEEQDVNPNGIWETNLFGKSLQSLINDGVNSKITLMPQDAQKKMRRTLTRIVNEGKGGIICILL